MTINRRVFGRLTPEKIDRILERLTDQALFTETE
jgi:NADH:ubiquinone oxidoreductase subunit E